MKSRKELIKQLNDDIYTKFSAWLDNYPHETKFLLRLWRDQLEPTVKPEYFWSLCPKQSYVKRDFMRSSLIYGLCQYLENEMVPYSIKLYEYNNDIQSGLYLELNLAGEAANVQ